MMVLRSDEAQVNRIPLVLSDLNRNLSKPCSQFSIISDGNYCELQMDLKGQG